MEDDQNKQKHDEIFNYFEALGEGITYCAPAEDTILKIEAEILEELNADVKAGLMDEESASKLLADWMARFHPR